MGFIIDYLREKFPLNRVVGLVTFVIAAPAAAVGGTVAAWIADHAPYIATQVGPDQIVAIFVTGATVTAVALVTIAYKWMEGWQKDEARIQAAAGFLTAPAPPSDADPGRPLLDEPGDDLKRALGDKPQQAHRAQDRGIGRVDEGEEFPTPQGG
jgi:hypothetical protein